MTTERAISALRELATGNRRTKIARLRELFEEVEAARQAGVTYATIAEVLKQEAALEFDARTLEVNLSRIRKERQKKSVSAGIQNEPETINAANAPSREVVAPKLSEVRLNADLSLTDDDYESFKKE